MLDIRNKNFYLIILIALAVTAIGLFEPLMRNDDPVLYANIAKQMILQHNWIDLYSGGQDWLDKPHFPFWMAALSFKIFGINSFAYVLPGYLFHILGAYYTYRLAKHLYNHEVGLLATLIYVTSLHLMLSAMDVRAEAYLLGEIMPACYYWLIYDKESSLKSLLLASFFTALALMTKGIFVVITIFSGLVAAWIYSGQFKKIIAPKWLLGYGLSLVFILPELICLYLQFDVHPEKVIFGQTHVSGILWYFWGSQFGRFFNSGPIVNKHGDIFFFVHTYLWAFLPWSMVFIIATYQLIKNFKKETNKILKAKQVYLLAAFWLTFIMFSATKFQLDHYTNIIMPFAAILCADYLYRQSGMKLAKFQLVISVLLIILTIGLTLYLFKLDMASISIILPLGLLIYIIQTKNKISYLSQITIYPALAISFAFVFIMLVNGRIYQKYDIGYNVAHFTRNHPLAPITIVGVSGIINNLQFHANSNVLYAESVPDLDKFDREFIIIKKDSDITLPYNSQIIGEYDGLPMEKFIPSLFNPKAYSRNLQQVKLVFIP
jgi:4-amino-4-deoxy-L-arabinose transferase-like glycosyltransferase